MIEEERKKIGIKRAVTQSESEKKKDRYDILWYGILK